MLLIVLDGDGNAKNLLSPGQETVVDKSGTITLADTAQDVMAANPNRSGWFFMNTGDHDMWINDQGDAVENRTCMKIVPGNVWPLAGYPLSTGRLSIISGNAGDQFIAREW